MNIKSEFLQKTVPWTPSISLSMLLTSLVIGGFMAFGIEGDPLASASWSADTTTWANNTKKWSEAGASSFFNTAGKSLVMASPTDTKMYRHNTGNTSQF